MIVNNEADTCRKFVLPKLLAAGWDTEPHCIMEQRTFTDGRIVITGCRVRRKKQKRADYLLRYRKDLTIAVVEAKPEYKLPADGLQQAKDYAEILGLQFAYSTNGTSIIEFDFKTGIEKEIEQFPTPEQLWKRLEDAQGITTASAAPALFTPYFAIPGKDARYYQEIAINRSVQAITQGNRRILLTLATGTGKTFVAFQICWKLWSAKWNRTGDHRRPKILFLADRNVLVDDPKDKMFTPFGDARYKIENGEANKGREMYFAIYQALAKDERRPGLYKEYPRDFFDLIIIDECHRGSARDESNWREILDYFEPAFQLGMTATPLRDDNRDTYRYFGNPIYKYSLGQGIEDGFLAPYKVHRIVTAPDALGWRPSSGQTDKYGQVIPDKEYSTQDFERVLSLEERTNAIARNLTEFLKSSDRYAKTIVFCVDQEHAEMMRAAIARLNPDMMQKDPNYVCRVTSDEGLIGRGHLSNFQDVESNSPTILTTSQLLTTGVDAPTCKNVVIVRIINSMSEFKQIIGRGTRVRDDYGKLYFNILDYTGSATILFADPDFDGYPAEITEEEMNAEGETVEQHSLPTEEPHNSNQVPEDEFTDPGDPQDNTQQQNRRKLYVTGGSVEIVAHVVYELDAGGKQLRVSEITDYTANQLRTLYAEAHQVRTDWADPRKRNEIIRELEERGIDFEQLAQVLRMPEADPLDLICHLAYQSPVRSRRERVQRVKQEGKAFFERFRPEARDVLLQLLEKYAEHGTTQFVIPDVLKVSPLSDFGNISEIANLFGGPTVLREAVEELQQLLYAA